MAQRLTVIKGGIDIDDKEKHHSYTFVSGWATDTRLMGAMALELTWSTADSPDGGKFHQLFHLNSKDRSIEAYYEGYGDIPSDFITERIRLVSALGGGPVELTEKESRFLLQSHMQDKSQQLPENIRGCSRLMKPEQTLTGAEYKALFDKICGRLDNRNYIINYFVMRCFAGDAQGAAWLFEHSAIADSETITPDFTPDMSSCSFFSAKNHMLLCRNKIEAPEEPDSRTYFCESLVEHPENYHIATSLITLNEDETRVSQASLQADFRITATEVSMLTSRSEFITVYEAVDFDDGFIEAFSDFGSVLTESRYENGRLFVEYRDSNDHAGSPLYLLNNDILAMYYLTDYGQILVAGYSSEDVGSAAFRMYLGLLPYPVVISGRYEFKNPILYEFMNSDAVSFEEFFEILREDSYPNDDDNDDGPDDGPDSEK